ncbi:MAG: sulfatase-like hydrolase/transferase [Luteolibacter sp.]
MKLHFLFLGILTGLSVAAERPNIVMVLIDDMGLMDTSVPFLAGEDGSPRKHPLNDLYHTPNMERLAANGFRASRFYANSVCSPTRASIMNGQSSARHRTTQWIRPTGINGGQHDPADWNWKGLGKKDVTMPRLLKAAGYHTIHCGKGHFGPFKSEGEDPRGVGFDVNIAGGAIGRPSSFYGKDGYGHVKGTSKTHAVPGLQEYRGTDTYLTEACTIEVNKEIVKAVEAKMPFFAYVSHYAVHSPFHGDPRFEKRYADKEVSAKGKAFATMIEGIDKSLGDILDQLEKLKVAQNTLVIFLGDNGTDAPLGKTHDHSCSAPLKGKKGTHYEGGMRVPFIAAWAKPSDAAIQKSYPIAHGVIDAKSMGTIHDLLPTILEVSGAGAPKEHVLDGASLWSWMSGKAVKQPQQFLMHFPHSHRSSYYTVYIENDWKLIVHHHKEGVKRHELFDLSKDPYEKVNLAAGNPAELRRMRKAMLAELKKADAQPSKPFKSLEEMMGE